MKEGKKPTAGIILAAGMSLRFGKPKQLMMLKDKTLLEWVIDACLNSRLEKIVLVLGYGSQIILDLLGEKIGKTGIQTVVNHRYHQGMSRSLQSGLSKISPTSPSVMFLLGDQPMVDANMINLLLERFWKSEKYIRAPVYQGKRGNPVIFSRNFYNDLFLIKNDIGARNIIQKNSDQVLWVEIDNPLYFFDIDTQDDLKRLRSYLT